MLVVVVVLGYAVFKHQYGIPGDSPFDRLAARPINVDFDAFSAGFDSARIKSDYHFLKFTCTPEPGSPLGDSVCWAPVTSVNGIDAKIAAFFFEKGKLSTVRLSFEGKYHAPFFSQMHVKYGPVRMIKPHGDIYGNNIVGWVRREGIVAINDHIEAKQEAIVLWISGPRILEKIFGAPMPQAVPRTTL